MVNFLWKFFGSCLCEHCLSGNVLLYLEDLLVPSATVVGQQKSFTIKIMLKRRNVVLPSKSIFRVLLSYPLGHGDTISPYQQEIFWLSLFTKRTSLFESVVCSTEQNFKSEISGTFLGRCKGYQDSPNFMQCRSILIVFFCFCWFTLFIVISLNFL